MYISLLKQLYFQKRGALEENWIYKQESKLKILKLRENLIGNARDNLSIDQISGRADIAEEVKDKLLRDGSNEDKVSQRLDSNIEKEEADIADSMKDELAKCDYSPEEFADYLFQSEMVRIIENVLSEERLFPEDVYYEQAQLAKEKQG